MQVVVRMTQAEKDALERRRPRFYTQNTYLRALLLSAEDPEGLGERVINALRCGDINEALRLVFEDQLPPREEGEEEAPSLAASPLPASPPAGADDPPALDAEDAAALEDEGEGDEEEDLPPPPANGDDRGNEYASIEDEGDVHGGSHWDENTPGGGRKR